MAPAAKSKKDTKSATKTAPAAPAAKKAPAKKAAAPKNTKEKAEEVSTGNKRKRVTFSEKEAKPTKPTKKKATGKREAEPKEVSKESDSEEEIALDTTKVNGNTDDDDDEDLTEEQEEALRKEILGDLASSDEGEDSSDDEDEDAIDKNASLVSLDGKKMKDSMAETKKAFDKKSKSSKNIKEEEKGVLYIGRIPHGFYEKEMKGYFSQFGDITRLRLSRNKRTGRSKHYGFIEFASAEVAKIVAETMDNYLLFGHLLQCKLVPADKVHDELFKGSEKVFKPKNYALLNRKAHNKKKTDEELQNKCKQLKQREEKLRQQIKDAGIEYDFPGFQ